MEKENVIGPEVLAQKRLEKMDWTDRGLDEMGNKKRQPSGEMTEEEKKEIIEILEKNILTYIDATFKGFLREIDETIARKDTQFGRLPNGIEFFNFLEGFRSQLGKLDKEHPLVEILDNLLAAKDKNLVELKIIAEEAARKFEEYKQNKV